MTIKDNLKDKVALLPESPGVYMYYDKDGTIIYIGKAKKLRRRVSSYFNRVHSVNRTNVLVKNIVDFKYIVVETEEDALHLENSLIKEYRPRYNVLLKDDKSYPWICVTNDPFPRVFLTRDVSRKGGKYYGPYSNVQMARTVIELIRELYPIRTCNHFIDDSTIALKKHKPCLQYHIKNCEACCVGQVSSQKYNSYIDEIRQILNGSSQQLCAYLIDEMSRLSQYFRFDVS